MDIIDIKSHLTQHEGYRTLPYLDTLGNLTIGVGFNLNAGLDAEEIDFILTHRINKIITSLSTLFPNFHTFSDHKQLALISLVYNIGWYGFLGFQKMITAIQQGDWPLASQELLNSLYATQVPYRAAILSKLILE